MANSITIKLGMPLHTWNDLNKLAKEINAKYKTFNVDIERYRECTKYGRLHCDLLAASLGAFEMLREPEFYK
ncbi:hypothetical protein [Fusobacterium gastrosuis]|uniref:hypothetical protein n=1 Tax=Fusobacterium gastrosuis TaxID=1755100 RepID=UPI002971AD55|nr:hypothetical protein [Fusobacteriaceae bacterium]MDY5713677.1 hypothetical protein [Fusobacterium gastrosuis]